MHSVVIGQRIFSFALESLCFSQQFQFKNVPGGHCCRARLCALHYV